MFILSKMKTIILRTIPPIDDFTRFVPKLFQDFPQLYLELLETQNKVNAKLLFGQEFCTNKHPSSLYKKENYLCQMNPQCKYPVRYHLPPIRTEIKGDADQI